MRKATQEKADDSNMSNNDLIHSSDIPTNPPKKLQQKFQNAQKAILKYLKIQVNKSISKTRFLSPFINKINQVSLYKITSPYHIYIPMKTRENNRRKPHLSKELPEVEVESILADKLIKGKKHYLIKWKAYGHHLDSWEPMDNLEGAINLVLIYQYQKGKRRTLDQKMEEIYQLGRAIRDLQWKRDRKKYQGEVLRIRTILNMRNDQRKKKYQELADLKEDYRRRELSVSYPRQKIQRKNDNKSTVFISKIDKQMIKGVPDRIAMIKVNGHGQMLLSIQNLKDCLSEDDTEGLSEQILQALCKVNRQKAQNSLNFDLLPLQYEQQLNTAELKQSRKVCIEYLSECSNMDRLKYNIINCTTHLFKQFTEYYLSLKQSRSYLLDLITIETQDLFGKLITSSKTYRLDLQTLLVYSPKLIEEYLEKGSFLA